jgi:hypothetical protein
MRKLRHADIAAIALVLALGAFWLFMSFKHPEAQRATGFGPEWQCTSPGRGGPAFCIKKSLLAPAKEAPPAN